MTLLCCPTDSLPVVTPAASHIRLIAGTHCLHFILYLCRSLAAGGASGRRDNGAAYLPLTSIIFINEREPFRAL